MEIEGKAIMKKITFTTACNSHLKKGLFMYKIMWGVEMGVEL